MRLSKEGALSKEVLSFRTFGGLVFFEESGMLRRDGC
jgi:hypothetical protein